jgi:CBS-domain-containing membrane protein
MLVHRVVVLDVERRLKGIVSTTDVLAALLRSV